MKFLLLQKERLAKSVNDTLIAAASNSMKMLITTRPAGGVRTFFHKPCLGALNKICVKVSSLLLFRARLARSQHKFPTWWWRKPLAATCVPAESREQTQRTPTPRKSGGGRYFLGRHALLSSRTRTSTRASPYLDRRGVWPGANVSSSDEMLIATKMRASCKRELFA